MKVIRDDAAATWTLVFSDASDVERLTEKLKPGDKLGYGGCKEDPGPNGEDFRIVYLHVGGRKERQKIRDSWGTTTKNVWVDSIKLILAGTDENDKFEINDIRNACFFGSAGLIFLGFTEIDGKKALVTTARLCKVCGKGMIDPRGFEYGLCDKCADKCQHSWTTGEGVSYADGCLKTATFCEKCGKMKEGTKPQVVKDQELRQQNVFNIHSGMSADQEAEVIGEAVKAAIEKRKE